MKDKLNDHFIALLSRLAVAFVAVYYVFSAFFGLISKGIVPIPLFLVRRRVGKVLKRLPLELGIDDIQRRTDAGIVTDFALFDLTLHTATGQSVFIPNIRYLEITETNLHPTPAPEWIKRKIHHLMQRRFQDSPISFVELVYASKSQILPSFDLIFRDNYSRYRVMKEVMLKDINAACFSQWLETESFESWFQEEYTRQFGSMNPELATLFEQVKSVFTGKFPDTPYQLIEIRYEDPEKQNLRLFFEDLREAVPSENSNKRIIKEKVIPVSPITSDLFEDHWSGNHL